MADRTQYNKALTGASAELRAAAHFMDEGYYVFRAVAAASPVDLVIYREGVCHRVEVKSATFSSSGVGFTRPRNNEWDLLAIADVDKVFVFGPERSHEDMRDEMRKHYAHPEPPHRRATPSSRVIRAPIPYRGLPPVAGCSCPVCNKRRKHP